MHALKDVNLEIPDGQFIGLIGHTGSGKSTLVQHLNGLVKGHQRARFYFNGENIYRKATIFERRCAARSGLVFQYPEHQLFETDVFSGCLLWPQKPQGWSRGRSERRARKAHASWWVFRKNFSEQSPV